MMLFVSFLLIAGSNICLCLSLEKHFKKLMKEKLAGPLKTRLRVAGYGLLLASLVVAFASESYLGLVYWCGLFSLVAAPMPFIIAYLDGPIRIRGRAGRPDQPGRTE
ncbi:MAG: DUF3325 domain-containing protein [Pseudomonadota bacterium]